MRPVHLSRRCRALLPRLKPVVNCMSNYASVLNEFLMLGNVATQFESKLEFDPVATKIEGNAEADALLCCEYRQNWTL